MKKTLVLGASTNPERYSYKAVHALLNSEHPVIPVGIKKGTIAGIEIRNDLPVVENLDTITLYLNPKRQEDYYDYILSLKPKRILFNPGAENAVLANLAKEQGIKV